MVCLFCPQDVFQSLEKLKATLLSLCAGARRLSEREKAERAVTDLQHSYEQSLKQAKDKQAQMENLLSLWQKYVGFHYAFTLGVFPQIHHILLMDICPFTR